MFAAAAVPTMVDQHLFLIGRPPAKDYFDERLRMQVHVPRRCGRCIGSSSPARST